jgi:hypothetical protein
LVSITAALTPWKLSSRRYVLLDVTWTLLLPPGCAWSYDFDHLSPGFTAESGSTA